MVEDGQRALRSRAALLLTGAGAGAVASAVAGLVCVWTPLCSAWRDVRAEGWWEQGLDRMVLLRLGQPLRSIDRWTMLGAAVGAGLALLLRRGRLRRRASTVDRTLATTVGSVGLFVLTVAVLLEAVRMNRSRRTPAGQLHVVWIVIDALRADHLGCYGYPQDTSPFLDSLAARSARFSLAISQESYTMASAASYFTSRYPPETKVLYDQPDIDALGRSFPTLAEVLKNAGYDTGAFVFNPHLQARYQFDQGFDVYDDACPQLGDGHITAETPIWAAKDTARPMYDKVSGFLDNERFQGSGRPKFLYLHYRDVHGPYIPPPEYAARFLPADYSPELWAYLAKYQQRPVKLEAEPFDPPLPAEVEPDWPHSRARLEYTISQYDGELRYTDDSLARLFEMLARHGIDLRTSIFVVTADHGEEFRDPHPGDVSGWGHGRTLYREQVHVPLLVSLPDQKAIGQKAVGHVIDVPVELVDIAPTILDAALGESARTDFRGRSLAPLVRGGTLSPRPVFAGGNHGRGLVVSNGLVYYRCDTSTQRRRTDFGLRPAPGEVGDMQEELYSLTDDPRQRSNLLAETTDAGTDDRRAARALEQLVAEWLARGASGPSRTPMPIDEHDREQLTALGYASGEDR